VAPRIGVLAIQGGFDAHVRMLRGLRADAFEVRTASQLDTLDALVLPGGESTTLMLSMARDELEAPLRAFCASGRPVLATCAGLIVLDSDHLGVLDVVCERNAFGRQSRSFEADLDVAGLDGGPLRAIFIRAPWIASHGGAVEVLASVDGHPVAGRHGQILATAFHPELGDDPRLHELWLRSFA
jgi:pyridoxal 5'-phosphate synthase pdxT subunit